MNQMSHPMTDIIFYATPFFVVGVLIWVIYGIWDSCIKYKAYDYNKEIKILKREQNNANNNTNKSDSHSNN